MKSKYLIILIMIVNCFIFFVIPHKVQAETTTNVYLEVPASSNSGDTITVIVKTNGSSKGLTGLQGTFDYDKNQLEYESSQILKEGWFISGFNKDTGIFLLEVNDISDEESFIYNDSEVASFTFKVKDTAIADNTIINVNNIVTPGAEQLDNTQTSETIMINPEKTVNTTITNTTSTNSKTENNNANSNKSISNKLSDSMSNTYVGNDGTNVMPYTGIDNVVGIAIIVILTLGFVTGIGYKKYRDI